MNDKNVFEMMDPYERNHVPLVVKTTLSITFQVPTHDIDQQQKCFILIYASWVGTFTFYFHDQCHVFIFITNINA
jgi:hypothetical protein